MSFAIKLICHLFSAEKNKDFTDNIKSDFSLEDLNFDPAAIIGEGTGDWGVSYHFPFFKMSQIYYQRMICLKTYCC